MKTLKKVSILVLTSMLLSSCSSHISEAKRSKASPSKEIASSLCNAPPSKVFSIAE